MSKFKIGDKVRVVYDSDENVIPGSIGIVEEAAHTNSINLVKFDYECFFRKKIIPSAYMRDHELELVEENKPMEQFKLKIGNNPELSKVVQEKAFELGYSWNFHGKTIKHTDQSFLFFSNKKLSYTNNATLFYEDTKEIPQISLEEFFEIKSNSHLILPSLTYEIVKQDNGGLKVGCQTISKEDASRLKAWLVEQEY